MNIAELKMKLEAIAEELETIQQEAVIEEETIAEAMCEDCDCDPCECKNESIEEDTIEEQEPSALDIAKMDPETRKQYFLAKKRMQPDTRTRDEKAADMEYAKARTAQMKADFFDEPKDTYGDMMSDRLKKLQQRKAYKDAAAGMGMTTRPSRFSFEDEQVEEAAVEEQTVTLPVKELEELMQLAGYAEYKIDEYANEPSEEYQDVEDQMIGLSGGLNGPKSMHPAAAGGDNPMDQEPRKVEESLEAVSDALYKSYKDFLDEVNKED